MALDILESIFPTFLSTTLTAIITTKGIVTAGAGSSRTTTEWRTFLQVLCHWITSKFLQLWQVTNGNTHRITSNVSVVSVSALTLLARHQWLMVISLDRGANDLQMAQLTPLPLCHPLLQISLTFLVPAYPGCPGKEAVKWVSVRTV